MAGSFKAFRVGTSEAGPALAHARSLVRAIEALLPGIGLEAQSFSSPGDRDRAILSGEIDCALLGAKDLPDPMTAELDWCRLPWRGDPHDPIVLRPDLSRADLSPDGQDMPAIVFKAGDARFLRLRSLFVRAVIFVGAGAGSADLCTVAGLRELRRAEVCIHDSLIDASLLDALPTGARRIDVGKRRGRHCLEQPEISRLISVEARNGYRVVRLKGGDPGIFGRLAEEIEALDALHLPYRVLPGVSSLAAATTGTGMLLTRRGVSRGFCALTPRRAGGGSASVTKELRGELPLVMFMAVALVRETAARLMADGTPRDSPAALVFGAGSDEESVVRGTLSDIGASAEAEAEGRPGLLVVGEVARFRFNPGWGALEGRSVLITCGDDLQDEAAGLVSDFGGLPLRRPLIRPAPRADAAGRVASIRDYDWLVLSSPSAVRVFGRLAKEARIDFRSLPKIMACGPGTRRAFEALGLAPDAVHEADSGAAGVALAARGRIASGERALRLRSDRAGAELAVELGRLGILVDDCVLYAVEAIRYDHLPDFDAAFFASACDVEVFEEQWGAAALRGKTVAAIGRPAIEALEARGIPADAMVGEAAVESALQALAAACVALSLRRETAGAIGPLAQNALASRK
jgi:uroporphyrinogen III methyltransferase/synthase